VHTPSIDKAWIASFAPLVLGLADDGDEHALTIVRREIRILARAAAAGIDALDVPGDGPTPVGLFGGTFKSVSLHQAFVDAVGELTDRPFAASVPRHTALVGAYGMALGADASVDDATIGRSADRLAADLEGRPGT
jgi:N-acetylglucosamine kinase-like BadF-type ATPase